MRPIDADALHDALKAKQLWIVRCGDKHNEGYTYDQVHFAINDAPTVDIDRPQGEWIEEYHGNGWNDYWDYTCSNCGKKYEKADTVLYKANFCPNCGADMRERKGE